MEETLAELEPYRERLPLFILKLYHILGVREGLVSCQNTASTLAGTTVMWPSGRPKTWSTSGS